MGMKCKNAMEPNTTKTSPRRTRAIMVATFMQASCADSFEIPILMSLVSLDDSLDPGAIEHGFEHAFSFEDFARNLACGARVFRVVGIDSFYSICDFVHCS